MDVLENIGVNIAKKQDITLRPSWMFRSIPANQLVFSVCSLISNSLECWQNFKTLMSNEFRRVNHSQVTKLIIVK